MQQDPHSEITIPIQRNVERAKLQRTASEFPRAGETISGDRTEKVLWWGGVLLFVAIMTVFFSAPAWTQHPSIPSPEPMTHEMQGMEDMPGMEHSAAMPEESAELKAKHLADKRESEFNHRFSGLLIVAAGILFLAQDRLRKRWAAARYSWTICLLVAGFFLLIFSDTEIWPFGYQSFWFALTHNAEVAQHKTFAAILLALGFIETFRVSGRLTASWSAWLFPALGAFGAILLLFHHHGGMHGPDAMRTMMHVKSEHARFASVAGGIAVTKGIAETSDTRGAAFGKIWPLLMILLGVLLLLYTE